MKIEKITLYEIMIPLKKPFITGFGEINNRGSLIIKVESEGYVGYGESPHLDQPIFNSEYLEAGKILLSKMILPRFLGINIDKPEDVINLMSDIKGNGISKAGIEMAIWDLFAKKEGNPLYEYLGGNNSCEVGVSLGIKNIDELKNSVKKTIESGYKRIKIKIKPGTEEYLKEIRKEFPNANLMVDANASYTKENMMHLLELDNLDLLMIEQPLAAKDLVEHANLQKKLKTKICLDESIECLQDLKIATKLGSLKILNIKPPRVGGITNTLELVKYCKQHNLGLWIGGMLETAIGKAVLAHIATLKDINYPGDITPSSEYLVDDIAVGYEPVNGIIKLPNKPGIGVDIDEDKLKKYGKVIEIG